MVDYSFTYRELEYFLLILSRVVSFVAVAPFFGMNNVPRRVKVAVAVFTSMLLFGVLKGQDTYSYNTLTGYFALVLKEAVTGVIIAFGAQFCISILSFAGTIIDMEIGLSMASNFDPTTRMNITVSGQILQYSVYLMLLISGMYQYLIFALRDSYRLIPIGFARLDSDRLMLACVKFLTDYIIIGFRIVLPVFAVILIMNCMLAILAKTSPQINMFTVGIQLKLLAGLSVLFITASLLPTVSGFIFREMRVVVTNFIEAMR